MITVINSPKEAIEWAPCIFLAGPIQGTGNWQSKAINYILSTWPSKGGDIIVASPRRDEKFDNEEEWIKQVDWEHKYLRWPGVTLFWLANEADHDCERAYAQTTRLELGEAIADNLHADRSLVVGIDSHFSGAKYIKRTLAKKAPCVPVRNYLYEACESAMAIIKTEYFT